MNKLVFGLAGLVMLGWSGAAQAQCMPGQSNFDACMQAQLGAMQQQTYASQQQLWQNYLNTYGPQLQQAYQEWGYQSGVTFEQFAYYMLMSANGTDPQGALEAQRQQFLGNQQAYRTQQQGFETYFNGIQQNSNAAIGAVEGYDTGAVRGNVIVNGPNGPVELPYSSMQNGQTVDANGYTYMMTPQGYAVWDGYGWQLVR
jgi:hypothetical protein